MVTSMRQIKKDNMKYAYATALANFSDAIVEAMANESSGDSEACEGREVFTPEMDTAHDVLFSQWLQTRDNRARSAVLQALGRTARLLTV
jgi:hypothetical protein